MRGGRAGAEVGGAGPPTVGRGGASGSGTSVATGPTSMVGNVRGGGLTESPLSGRRIGGGGCGAWTGGIGGAGGGSRGGATSPPEWEAWAWETAVSGSGRRSRAATVRRVPPLACREIRTGSRFRTPPARARRPPSWRARRSYRDVRARLSGPSTNGVAIMGETPRVYSTALPLPRPLANSPEAGIAGARCADAPSHARSRAGTPGVGTARARRGCAAASARCSSRDG
jgi:hypothetical protein